MIDVSRAIDVALQYHQGNHLAEAEQIYRQILQYDPHHVQSLHLLGLIAYQANYLEDAIAHYQQVISIAPDYVWVYNDLGTALRCQGSLDAAIDAYQTAILLKPDFAHAYYNLGNALRDSNYLEDAIIAYQQAIAYHSTFTEALYNLGIVLQDQGKLDEAAAYYRQILTFKPDDVNAHWNLAIVLLLSGDLAPGFAEFEWRWHLPEHPPRSFTQPLWDGSFLNGQTVLLHAEQGFGDTIQFIRYLPLVAQRGGKVIVECQSPLIQLLKTVDGAQQLVARNDSLPEFDVHAPLMSLPWLLGTKLETIPVQIPYLAPLQASPILERSPHAQLHIGIVWAGNPERKQDGDRSCPLTYFQEILDIPGIAFYSLQKGVAAADLAQLNLRGKIQDVSQQLNDFADTAAIVMQLDLVITVDTAVAHLAGALGHPAWVLLSYVPDWRWMLSRSDSPWYPSVRLFRQNAPGDWTSVFNQVGYALSKRLSEKQHLWGRSI